MQAGLFKLSGQAALIVLAIAILAIWPCWHFNPEKGLLTLLMAALVCFLPACVSLVPLVMALKRQADWLAQACLGGTAVRLLLTLAAGLVVYVIIEPPMMTFVWCLLVFYVGLLVWETTVAVKFIQAFYARTSSIETEKLSENNAAKE